MSKRVFELAKELNTTSKRLIEKLGEINIKVKSHMSLLEENELDRLYKHIGVVNRNRVAGSDDGNKVDQQEQAESQVRKSIPRIIRKTEIIIHDDEYEQHNKEKDKKKNKRNYVRTSSNTDGLMAGLQRGSDNPVPNIRKHNPDKDQRANGQDSKSKTVEPKVVPDIGDEGIIGINPRGDRIRRPMDNILSIKKVIPRDEREKQDTDEFPDTKDETIKTEQNKQINTEQEEQTKTNLIKSKKSENRSEIGNQKETVSAGAEKSEGHMVIETQKNQQAKAEEAVHQNPENAISSPQTEPKVQGSDKKNEGSGEKQKISDEKDENTIKAQNKALDNGNSKETNNVQTQLKKGTANVQDTDKSRTRNSTPEQRPQRNRDDNQGRDRFNQQGGDRQNNNQQNRGSRGNDNRSDNRNDDRRNFNRDNGQNRPYNRDGGQNRPFNRDGGQNRPFNREGGQNRPYNRDGGQNRPFNRDGGQNRPYNRDGGQNRPFNRDGGQNRPFNRDGGYNKDDQGRGFDRNRDDRSRGRNDDRSRSGNRPLVIPKANLAPGQVEEKNNIRGERRTAITRDVEKVFKREAKKDTSRTPATIGPDKGREKYVKDFVVGHTANVSDMYSDDFVLNEFYEEKVKPKKDRSKRKDEKHIPHKAVLIEITIPETITVKNLAEELKKTAAEVIKKLMGLGIMATLNQELDFDTASIIGDEFGVKVHKEVVVSDEDILFDDVEDNEEELVERAPVVVVMGHVDHGKTSLLDAIRETNVVDKEAGGITQHIGAYKVNLNGRDITFLDTPGHEAFTSMRARGAKATDIAILVVAADDGVMPQTVEAINHAKAAEVSMIVAINKIDKPGANPDRVKQELAEHNVLIEEWGGDVIAVPVSAKMGTNIDQLLEMVLLTADVMELKSNPNRQAKGIVIEAKLDKGRGPVASVLVQRGTLHSGDSIISGTTFGRIRAMTDEKGRKVDDAGPSTPVEIIGLDEVPEAGDVFYAVEDEKVAKHLVEQRRSEQRAQAIGTNRAKVSLDDLFNQIQQGEMKELNIIVKADVQGSVEAVKQSVEKLSNEEVIVKVIHGGVGAINEADVTLAEVSNAIIIGFNVRPPANVIDAAEAAGVDMRLYRIIYNAIEDIEKAMKGLLDPTFKEVVDGHIEIRQTFKASSVGTIGGGYVTDGKVTRNSDVRVVRNGIVVFEGKLASLKRFKDDVREVAQGYECGILVERFNDIKEGDVIEAFRMEEVERT